MEKQVKQENSEKKQENETEEIVIDAADSVLGRMASYAAKQLIYGKHVVIINSEKAKIIGQPRVTMEDFLAKSKLGKGAQKGPLISKRPADIMRRAVRGMLERRRSQGRAAFKRLRCYEGVPLGYKNKEKISIEKKQAIKFVTLEQLSKHLGR